MTASEARETADRIYWLARNAGAENRRIPFFEGLDRLFREAQEQEPRDEDEYTIHTLADAVADGRYFDSDDLPTCSL